VCLSAASSQARRRRSSAARSSAAFGQRRDHEDDTERHAELLPQRRDALEWWSVELARILAGEPEKGMGKAGKIETQR
jgi:hypothetical protein